MGVNRTVLVIIHRAKMSSAFSDNRGKGKRFGFSNPIAAEEGVSRFVRLTLLASYILRVFVFIPRPW